MGSTNSMRETPAVDMSRKALSPPLARVPAMYTRISPGWPSVSVPRGCSHWGRSVVTASRTFAIDVRWISARVMTRGSSRAARSLAGPPLAHAPAALANASVHHVAVHAVDRRNNLGVCMSLIYSAVRDLTVALTLVALVVSRGAAQSPTFTPDHANGIYDAGARVGWTVTLPRPVAKDARGAASPSATGPYTYTIRRDGGTVVSTGTLDPTKGRARIETTLAEPAMLLVEVKPPRPDSTFGTRGTGGPGRVLLGAAVAPTRIHAAEPKPADFDAFWAAKLQQLAAIPMNAVVTPGESGRPGVEYATVRMNNIHGSHVYGQLAKPAGDGKFPALVVYQWASPPYPLQKPWVTDRAAEGWLALNVEPHDVPSDMPQAFYDALPALIKQYNTIGQHSRDESYFLRMYLGAYRAVEYLASRPDWDGKTIVVMGTSMGGQQSFATAGLNPRVTALIVDVPAGADVAATVHGRGASYPNWNVSRPEVLETARYFDAANFASRITARSLVAMGFIDEIAAPTGIWSVFNQIQGPKEAAPMVDSPHNHLATPRAQEPYTTRAAAWLNALVHGGDPTAAASGGRPPADVSAGETRRRRR
jgi:cephalosporin-C deacetylase-like acetyl esterase